MFGQVCQSPVSVPHGPLAQTSSYCPPKGALACHALWSPLVCLPVTSPVGFPVPPPRFSANLHLPQLQPSCQGNSRMPPSAGTFFIVQIPIKFAYAHTVKSGRGNCFTAFKNKRSNKSRRQKICSLWKEQDKTPGRNPGNGDNLPDKEFKVIVIRIH